MQDIKSLMLFLGRCGPLHMALVQALWSHKLLKGSYCYWHQFGYIATQTHFQEIWDSAHRKHRLKTTALGRVWWNKASGLRMCSSSTQILKRRPSNRERPTLHWMKLWLLIVTMALEIRNWGFVCLNTFYFWLVTTLVWHNLCSSAPCPWQGTWAQLPCPVWVRLAALGQLWHLLPGAKGGRSCWGRFCLSPGIQPAPFPWRANSSPASPAPLQLDQLSWTPHSSLHQ